MGCSYLSMHALISQVVYLNRRWWPDINRSIHCTSLLKYRIIYLSMSYACACWWRNAYWNVSYYGYMKEPGVSLKLQTIAAPKTFLKQEGMICYKNYFQWAYLTTEVPTHHFSTIKHFIIIYRTGCTHFSFPYNRGLLPWHNLITYPKLWKSI